ncbi:hypothetical protein ACOJUR_15855 [Alicyclobacillus tolerans]|uniref:ParM/StbA family protein n=1 Tax=Alicyclobacillus tolerans TaxID=90970 RepID=UPI003B784BD2
MSSITRIAAVDIGNDSLKAVFPGHKVHIPNVVANMSEERQVVALEQNPLDGLHCSILSGALKQGKGVFAVGKLASEQENHDEVSVDMDKATNDQTIVMLLTALALDAVQSSQGDNSMIEATYKLSTGLPLRETKRKLRPIFRDRLLQNSHEVTFLDTPVYQGKRVRIQFEEVLVGSEGHAAMVDLVLNENGSIKNEELMNAHVLIHDIGGMSTDSAIIKPGGDVDNTHSEGLKEGVSPYLDQIIDKVLDEYGYTFRSRKNVVDVITDAQERYQIYVKGNRTSIKSIVDEVFLPLAREEYKQIRKLWTRIPEIRFAYLIGGGAVLLKDYLETLNRDSENYPLRFLEAEQSVWSIANAYYKLALSQFTQE